MKSAGLHEVYSPAITQALKSALQQFEQKIPGFVSDAGLLHGVETRTSSPVCCVCCAVLHCAVLCCAALCCAVLFCSQAQFRPNKQTFHNQNRASRHGSCPPFVVLITETRHAKPSLCCAGMELIPCCSDALLQYRKSCRTVLMRCL